MTNDDLSCGGGVSEPVVAVIDCRKAGSVRLLESVDVQEGEELTVIPSPRGGIVVVGPVTSSNEAELLRLVHALTTPDELP